MKKKNRKILFLLLLGIGIGYATVSKNIGAISAITKSGKKFDVHFENFTLIEGVSSQEPTISANETTMQYYALLEHPGDNYVFSIDVVNDGNIDAMIYSYDNVIVNSTTETTDNVPTTLTTSAKYNIDEPIQKYNLLPAGESYTIIVTLDDSSNLNTEAVSQDTTFYADLTIRYVKADASAKLPGSEEWKCQDNKTLSTTDVLCKRSSLLDYSTCSSGTCGNDGYSSENILIYGSCGTVGSTIQVGDAFTCDINNDGTFDESTEKFYYLSDYNYQYAGIYNSSYATLVSASVRDSSFGPDWSNYDWSNPHPIYNTTPNRAIGGPSTSINTNYQTLVDSTRQIFTENGNTFTSAGQLPSVTYGKYRQVSLMDLSNCLQNNGISNTCNFLFEGTTYDGGTSYDSMWLEDSVEETTDQAWEISVTNKAVEGAVIGRDNYSGVSKGSRYIIDVDKNNISY